MAHFFKKRLGVTETSMGLGHLKISDVLNLAKPCGQPNAFSKIVNYNIGVII